MYDDLKFSSIENAAESLKFSVEEDTGSKAVKKLITSFYSRKEELDTFMRDKSLSKEAYQDYKLELKILKTAIKEFEKGK